MTTILGKALVFLIVFVSLAGFGTAVWLLIDYRDWDKTVKDISQETERRKFAKRLEEVALADVMMELKSGSRRMPWDVQAQLTQPNPPQPTQSVKQATGELGEIAKVNEQKLNEATTLQAEYGSLVSSLARARNDSMEALAEQKNLREQIKPEDPNLKPLRDLTGDAITAKQAAEAGQERIRPDLVNERAKLFLLLERQNDLKKRLAELDGIPNGK